MGDWNDAFISLKRTRAGLEMQQFGLKNKQQSKLSKIELYSFLNNEEQKDYIRSEENINTNIFKNIPECVITVKLC